MPDDPQPITFEEALKRVHAYQPPNKKQRADVEADHHEEVLRKWDALAAERDSYKARAEAAERVVEAVEAAAQEWSTDEDIDVVLDALDAYNTAASANKKVGR